MTALLALSLAYAGFAGLSLAMDRHQRQVWGRRLPAPRARSLRIAGWLLIGLSILPCFVDWSWRIAIVAWLGVLPAAAMLWLFALPYAPRIAARAAIIAPPLCALAAALGQIL